MMALAATISTWQAQNVASLFDTVVDNHMPAYASSAGANVRSLEEALLICRVVIVRQNGSSVSAAHKDAVLSKGKAAEFASEWLCCSVHAGYRSRRYLDARG